jgi:hypothetical protein
VRDFRAAKAAGSTLRAAPAAKGHKITISEILQETAEPFGVAVRTILAAAIPWVAISKAASPSPLPIAQGYSPQPHPISQRQPAQRDRRAFSVEHELTLDRALSLTNVRDHKHATLERLLVALTDDAGASAVMKNCKVDVVALQVNVANHIGSELKTWATVDGAVPC